MVMSESFHPGWSRRARLSIDQGSHSLPGEHRKAFQRSKLRDQRIARVLEIKLEPLGRMYRRVSRRQAVPSCKGQGGVLEQEKTPGLPLRIPGNPEAFLVATDEKLRDRRR
jgi:hypothetical protein